MNIASISVNLAKKYMPFDKMNDDNIEIISYGITALITSLINTFVAFIVAMVLGQPMEFIIFTLIFVPIRCQHKSYHCKSFTSCVVTSNILIALFTYLCKSITFAKLQIILLLPLLVIHYFLSHERKMKLHICLILLYMCIGFHFPKIQIYFLIALVFNILLMLGGRIDECSIKK